MATRQINIKLIKVPSVTTAKMNTGGNTLSVPLLAKSSTNKIEQQSVVISTPTNRLNNETKKIITNVNNNNNNKSIAPIKQEINNNNIHTKSPTVSIRSFGKKRAAPQVPPVVKMSSSDVKQDEKPINKEALSVNDNVQKNQKTINSLFLQSQQLEILSNVKENVMQGLRFSANTIDMLKNKPSNSASSQPPTSTDPIITADNAQNKELNEVVVVKGNSIDSGEKSIKTLWEKYEFSDAEDNDCLIEKDKNNRNSVISTVSFHTDDDFYETADETYSNKSVSENEICSTAASILNMRSTLIGPLSKETYEELEADQPKSAEQTLELQQQQQNEKFSDNITKYIQKKSLAQGMMDLALVSANTNQLRYVLDAKLNHPYFYTSLSLIITSLVLQVVVGITLLWNSRLNIERKTESKNAVRSNNFSVIGIFIVTLINVFISTFGGSPFAGSSAEVVAIPAEAMDPS